MLRQIITKALEMKRAEIAELPGPGDTEQLPARTLPSAVQTLPQRLTFYEVVQLARQQAYLEKSRKSHEDLIDLSDTPELSSSFPALGSGQGDLALLDSGNSMPAQQVYFNRAFHGQTQPAELESSMGRKAVDQPAVAEPDTALPAFHLNSQAEDLIGLVELDASRPNGLDTIDASKLGPSAETPTQYRSQIHELSGSLFSQHGDTLDQAGLEDIGTQIRPVGGVDINKDLEFRTVDSSTIPQQPALASDDTPNEASGNRSPASSAAPSVFSHSSSLTSATGCSLPGITEEDQQRRGRMSQISLKAPPVVANAPSSPLNGMASSPADGPVKGFPIEPQGNQSDDIVSLPAPPPQVPEIDEPDKQGFPWIVQAARDGDEEMVRKLLVSGADIEAAHVSTQRHALAEAASQGHQKIVDLLIEEGCPLDCVDAEGNTALHHACQRGHLAIAKSLISKGASIDTAGSDGQSALHSAMHAPYPNVVMLLVQHEANVNARDASFRTPLHIAASKGNVAMCNYLLNEGAQLDSREAQSKTPLQLACEAGYYELGQLMLDHSKLTASNMTFLAAFFAAVEHGHVRIAESFFSQGLKLPELKRDRQKPLTLAAKSGCLAMVELMMHEGCDINARDESGWNALHFASYHGQYQVIERLISSGVSAKATTSRKETPLLLAVKNSHFPVAERLLRSDNHSSLVGAADERGEQLVHHAVRAGSLEIFNLLMSNGGRVDMSNCFGWQPLHIATAYGHPALVERLLQQGANIEEKLGSSSIKKDQTHRTVEEGYWAEARWPYPGSRALHLACEYGHEHIASLLIAKGAKMEVPCGEGWQPLHHAAYFGSPALVETLLQGGVNPHATTNEGKTASTLGYCTTGPPIPTEHTEHIHSLLKEAMNRVKKQKNFKVALKKASTVEDKGNLLRAATFSMTRVSRPPLQKAKTTAPASDPASERADSTSSSLRPRLPRPSYTSPLPPKDSPLALAARNASILGLPVSEAEPVPPSTLHSTTDLSRKSTDTTATGASSNVLVLTRTPNEAPQPNSSDIADATPAPKTETQLSPQPKMKRRTTFGLAKVDMGKLSRASMGKPTFEIGKQTMEIGNKTLELGKQGLEMSKQGLGMSRQGLEMGKKGIEAIQGLEVRKGMGKSADMGKQGYKKAKELAKKGKRGVGMKREKRMTGEKLEASKNGEKSAENDIDCDDEEEGDESDEAGSVFSLGEFADLGNKDF